MDEANETSYFQIAGKSDLKMSSFIFPPTDMLQAFMVTHMFPGTVLNKYRVHRWVVTVLMV